MHAPIECLAVTPYARLQIRTGRKMLITHQGVQIDTDSPLISGPIKEAIRAGYYELPECQAVRCALNRGDVVLELGAGCGFISTYIAKLERAKKIYAVEANPAIIPLIGDTYRLNGVNVELHNIMLAKEQGEVEFSVHPDFWASRANNTWDGAEKVRVRSESFLKTLNDWSPSFLIMDIEGGELELLELGLSDSVQRVVLELHPWAYGQEGVDRIQTKLRSMGFRHVPWASSGDVVTYTRGGKLRKPRPDGRHPMLARLLRVPMLEQLLRRAGIV